MCILPCAARQRASAARARAGARQSLRVVILVDHGEQLDKG
jgi:hypothetical protein